MKHIHLIISDELGEQLRVYAHKNKIKQTPVIIQALESFFLNHSEYGFAKMTPQYTLEQEKSNIMLDVEETAEINKPATSPDAPRREENTKDVHYAVSRQEDNETESMGDNDGNRKPTPDSVLRTCPFCNKKIYGEFAQVHYAQNH